MGIGDAEMTAITPYRIGLRLVLEFAARAHPSSRVSFSETARRKIFDSLDRVWREIEAMELHPAGEATLSYELRSARHGLLTDDLPELLHWVRAIKDKVNLELRWEEDASRRAARAADRGLSGRLIDETLKPKGRGDGQGRPCGES
jgi:hypothetical protein